LVSDWLTASTASLLIGSWELTKISASRPGVEKKKKEKDGITNKNP
jgi:hypothetical protein